MSGNLARRSHLPSYFGAEPQAPLSGLHVFSNPMMKSAIVTYTLTRPSEVKIRLTSVTTGATVKDIFLIPGNPGGRRGENKVLWDGRNHANVKVPVGKYRIEVWVEDTCFAAETLRF